MLRYVGGALLVLLGVVLVGVSVPAFMQRDVRPFLEKAPRGPAGAFVMGVAFAFGWTPCVGPILGGILTMAAEGSDPAAGALLLFVYSLGMGIPFLVAGLFVGLGAASVRPHTAPHAGHPDRLRSGAGGLRSAALGRGASRVLGLARSPSRTGRLEGAFFAGTVPSGRAS